MISAFALVLYFSLLIIVSFSWPSFYSRHCWSSERDVHVNYKTKLLDMQSQQRINALTTCTIYKNGEGGQCDVNHSEKTLGRFSFYILMADNELVVNYIMKYPHHSTNGLDIQELNGIEASLLLLAKRIKNLCALKSLRFSTTGNLESDVLTEAGISPSSFFFESVVIEDKKKWRLFEKKYEIKRV